VNKRPLRSFQLPISLVRTAGSVDPPAASRVAAQWTVASSSTPYADAKPVTDVADLRRQLDDILGTDLSRVITELSSAPEAAEQVLRVLTAQAQGLAAAPREDAAS
jgi:hypothetical protein